MNKHGKIRAGQSTAGCRLARAVIVVMGGAALLVSSGCATEKKTGTGQPTVEYKQATRDEMLSALMQNANKIGTLRARATVAVVDTSGPVPATLADAERKRRGKTYRKFFLRRELTGSLLIKRNKGGARKVRLWAEFLAGYKLFMLGVDDEFWVLVPGVIDEGGKTDIMLRGTLDRLIPRPLHVLTARPQDVIELMLYDYLNTMEQDIGVGMETWRDEYVIQVLHRNRPEWLYSKIWIHRRHLRPRLHQLFDADGTLICEARFASYVRVADVELPKDILLIWPKEEIDVEVRLDRIKINNEIDPKFFKPKKWPRVKTVLVEQDVEAWRGARIRPKRGPPEMVLPPGAGKQPSGRRRFESRMMPHQGRPPVRKGRPYGGTLRGVPRQPK